MGVTSLVFLQFMQKSKKHEKNIATKAEMDTPEIVCTKTMRTKMAKHRKTGVKSRKILAKGVDNGSEKWYTKRVERFRVRSVPF